MRNVVLHFETSEYAYSGKFFNLKIFHNFKGGQNAAFQGDVLFLWIHIF